MKKNNFNSNWEFIFDKELDVFNDYGISKYSDAVGAPARFLQFNNWRHIDLPHDWAIGLPKDVKANTFAGGRANTHFHRYGAERHSNVDEVYNVGWYRKVFEYDQSWSDKRIFLEFEGVFRDAVFWVNGVYLDRHFSGYNSFVVEITDHLVEEGMNSVAVRVDTEQPEGWFYEGAGIYRNVNLLVGEAQYFKPNKTVIKTKLDGTVTASAVLVNDTAEQIPTEVKWNIIDAQNQVVAEKIENVCLEAYSESKISVELKIENPLLWHVDTPNLYTLSIKACDETQETFGVRTVSFDANRGFLLNDEPLKLHGACVHQDFGGVGVALTDNLHKYKIQKLKEMGVNAYRASHHAPAPSLLRACDELGMLVMDECRMFGTAPEALRQLTDLIERDRNHPSVFIWCVGNEEFSIHNTEWSNKLLQKVTRIVKTLDDTRAVTYGGCNGPNFVGANGAAEVRGINYIRNGAPHWVDKYHEEHPEQPIIGTEESSYVLSRGGKKNDLASGKLDSTGSVTMPWGSTPKGWVKFFEERDYLAGGFMWTGFDYHGEPNPFYDSNMSSSFGTIDLCGIEKPPFYYYKAWWTNEPVLKLAPHWDYAEGEVAEITVYTNCQQVTLYVNDKKIGTKTLEKFDIPTWTIPFEKGSIRVEGTKDGITYRDELHTPGKVADVRSICVLKGIKEDDVSIIQLEAVDENGVFCPNADNLMELALSDGKIIGVGNGDPSSLDYEQLLPTEEIKLLRSFNTEFGAITFPEKAENEIDRQYTNIVMEPYTDGFCDDYRKVATYKYHVEEAKKFTFTTTISNVKEYQYVEFERISGEATIYLNGKQIGHNRHMSMADYNTSRPYRFYCDFAEGDNELTIEIMTHKDCKHALSGYIKVGKEKQDKWNVRLHYGKAVVIVKSTSPELLQASLCEGVIL